ncbi:MAG: hypothetical protein JSW68_02940 [Burkholderiales bacterium]|nr:MAG: hypothetical protein JSW68_02940 [Burkholderiales bacterium]
MGADSVEVLDCASGRSLARTRLPAPLAAPVAADFARGALYVATRTPELLRYSLPGLSLQARTPLQFEPTALAVPSDPDAVVLAGGAGRVPLVAHDPNTLAVMLAYRLEQASTVSAIVDVAGRRRMVVGFADRSELWEIAYGRDAPPVLRGLVHDYRSKEAVPLPGRLTERAFEVANGTRALVAAASSFEVLRIDELGAPGVVNLDVRREIDRPAVPGGVQAPLAVAWRAAGARGWVIARADGTAYRLQAPSWKLSVHALGGPVLALAATSDAGRLLGLIEVPGAHVERGPGAASGGSAVMVVTVRVDARDWEVEPQARLELQPRTIARVAAGSQGGCTAALDAAGRWLARLAPR